MVSQIKNKFSIAVGIIGILGSFLTLIGFSMPYAIYPNDEEHPGLFFLKYIIQYDGEYYSSSDLLSSIFLIFLILILIFSFLTIISEIQPKLNTIFNENILFFTLVIFFLVPIMSPFQFASPGIVLTDTMTNIAEGVAYYSLRDISNPERFIFAPGFFIVASGIFFTLIAFFMSTLSFFWRYSARRANEDEYDEEFETVFEIKNIFKIIIGALAIIAGLGVFFGIALPYYDYVYRSSPPPTQPRNPSLLLPEMSRFDNFEMFYQAYPDFNAILFMLYGLFICLVGLIVILSNSKIINKPVTLGPLILFLVIVLFLPIYSTDYFFEYDVWFPSSIQIFYILTTVIDDANYDRIAYANEDIDSKLIVTGSGRFFYISIYILLAVFLLCLGQISFQRFPPQRETEEFQYEPESDDDSSETSDSSTKTVKTKKPMKRKAKIKQEKILTKEMTEKEKAIAELLQSIDASAVKDDTKET
ncbi:MAG TPA: hypothetical protein VMX55_06645 [candidate division Zixibacteria bacterium]|nr:hypothetical protein [candidate division Zixibacteria bacterium]